MLLSKQNLQEIRGTEGLIVPDEQILDLPEKVLQFGTGVLLRGLPDYFIDKANRAGVFNGRVVIVKSTPGSTEAFDRQDNLYTLCIRGISNGSLVKEHIVHSCISRVLSAAEQWEEVLKLAESSELELIISNTTEVGISLVEEKAWPEPPVSFPARLLAVLYRRYRFFGGDPKRGLVIVPTELVPDNGDLLKGILRQLAIYNQCDEEFLSWLEEHNQVCNSLVDRIVPGAMPGEEHQQLAQTLGYRDELMIMSEDYALWAIESKHPRVSEVLSFRKTDERVIIAENIFRYKELKLRVLNASHSFGCAMAILSGLKTVKEAMEDESFSHFLQQLMLTEIVPAITGPEISEKDAITFAQQVLERFRNPYLDHSWQNITAQYTLKMKGRAVPLIFSYYGQFNKLPVCMLKGFAAYLLLMGLGADPGSGIIPVRDEFGDSLLARLRGGDGSLLDLLSDQGLWGADLSSLPGLVRQVAGFRNELVEEFDIKREKQIYPA